MVLWIRDKKERGELEMTIVDYLSLYAIIAIWILMFVNIILSIGGFIYYMKVEKTDGHVKIDEYPMVSVWFQDIMRVLFLKELYSHY